MWNVWNHGFPPIDAWLAQADEKNNRGLKTRQLVFSVSIYVKVQLPCVWDMEGNVGVISLSGVMTDKIFSTEKLPAVTAADAHEKPLCIWKNG